MYKLIPIAWILLCAVCANAQNNIDHWEAPVSDGAIWTYTVPTSTTASNWRQLGFTPDTTWRNGMASIGYGDGDDATLVPSGTTAVFMRYEFNIVDTAEIVEASFAMDYDDGFVAYLNGVEIARANVNPANPAYNTLAAGAHEAQLYTGGQPTYFRLTKATLSNLLVPGNNVLAVQAHNETAGSSDLTALPVFAVGLNNNLTRYNATPFWFVEPWTFESSNLPIVIINANNQNIGAGNFINARMGIIYNGAGQRNYVTDPQNNYYGAIGIHVRGSSSQGFPKKSYRVETRDSISGQDQSVSMLGLPSESDWILYAPYTEKTMLRDALIYRFGSQTMAYSPRTRYVEVVVDGDYKGVYVLTERIKRDQNRVNIANLTPNDTIGDQLTGGYVLKIDRNTGAGSYFTAINSGAGVVFDDPDGAALLPVQKAYIENYVNSFEQALSSPNFADPDSGYQRYIDRESFMDFFIANEFSNNVDGYRLSTFFYKDKDSRGGKLTMGPLWDFNLTLGNANYCNGQDTTAWSYTSCNYVYWWERLLEDPAYADALRCRYQYHRQRSLSEANLFHWIDSMAVELDEAQTRNYRRWPILGQYVWPNFFIGNTYQEEIDYMKTWISGRLRWLDANMPGSCPFPPNNNGTDPSGEIISSTPTLEQQTLLVAYPNPAREKIELRWNGGLSPKNAVRLVDMMGRVVAVHPLQNTAQTVPLAGLAAGVYELQILDGSNLRARVRVVVLNE